MKKKGFEMRSIKVGMLCGQMTWLLLTAIVGAMAEDPQTKPLKGQPAGTAGGTKTPATSAGIIDRSVMLTTARRRQEDAQEIRSALFGLPDGCDCDPQTVGQKIVDALFVYYPIFSLNPSQKPDALQNRPLVDRFSLRFSVTLTSTEMEFLEYLEKRPRVKTYDFRDLLFKIYTNLENDKTERTVKSEVLRLQALYEVLKSDFLDTKYQFKPQIVNLEEQIRVVGEQNYFATNVHYGNAKLRSDVSAQYTTGSRASFGLAFHYDLNGYSYNGIGGSFTLKMLAANDFQKTAKLLVGRNQEDARLVRYILAPQAGVTFDYRHLYGTGDLYGMGLSTSLLSPLTSRFGSQAIYSSVGIRYSWLEQNVGTETPVKGLGFSAVFAWQDTSPSYRTKTLACGREIATTNLDRWHRRFGVEFAQRNAIVQGDYGALFLKLRDRGRGEYSFLVGSEANGVGFVGFNASTYFAW